MSARKAMSAEPKQTAADRLRTVATNLFYKHGIRAVGVDEIVNETGVTKPTLYRSFASKDELVATCLRREIAESIMRWDAVAERFPGDPLGQMRGIIRLMADDIASPTYRGCALINAAVEFPEAGHPVRQVTQDCKMALHSRFAEQARQLGVDDPQGLADGLVLVVEGASSSRHISGCQGPAASLVRTTEALIAAHLPDQASGRR
jgi:AcrR family transcriptional regulator